MSATLYSIRGACVVEDIERLPADVEPDHVAAKLAAHLDEAAQEWHRTHPGLLRCEPDIFLG